MKHKILAEHKMESYENGYCKEIYIWYIWDDTSSVKQILTQELIDGNIVNETVEYQQEIIEYQEFGATIKVRKGGKEERISWNLPKAKLEPEPFIPEKEFMV